MTEMTDEETIRDASNKIKYGHYKNACGPLRFLLEKHLKQLCAENPRVHPKTGSISDMILALFQSSIINSLTKAKFFYWKNLGNAGSHPESPPVEKKDAVHFLEGIAKLLKINIGLNPAIKTEIEQQPPIEKPKNKSVTEKGDENSQNTSLTKKQAIKFINKKTEHTLNDKNCGFSNINKSKPVWWLDPAVKKFEDDFFIVLNDSDKNSLYLFKLPAKTINKPKETFRPKGDKQVSIEIKADNIDQFTDIKSGGTNFQFRNFLIETIRYRSFGE